MNVAPFIVIVRRSQDSLSAALDAFIARLRDDPGLKVLMEHSGLLVIGMPAAPHFILPGGDGLVWGHLFDRARSQRVAGPGLPRGEAGDIDAFSRRFWGGYVRVRASADGVEIARDPSGAVPCYHASIGDAEIFTSRPELLHGPGLIRPEIDWTIVTQAIAYRDLRPARTARRGVSELMPGMSATVSPAGIRLHCFWSPWMFAEPAVDISLESAAQAVKRVTSSCVGAWAGCFDRPMVEISGGLDSSIVAACVIPRRPEASCVTFASAPGDPDETPYAMAVTSHLGIPLELLRARIADIDLTRSHASHLPRPCARAFAQALDARLRQMAADLGTDAFFSGGGGDNVFCYLQSVLPVIDRLRGRGPAGLVETMEDVASVASVSVWEVAWRTVGRALRRRSALPWTFEPRWLSREAAANLPFPAGHPWLKVPDPVLPGKRIHGQSLIVIQNHLEGFDRLNAAPVISPLLSQPLVETCMAIPAWLWCAGGENRAVARHAFERALPDAVLRRQTKGAFDSYCAQIFEANRSVVGQMLLDGELARHRIIDTEAIHEALSTAAISRRDILGLLGLVDIEAWVTAVLP